MTKTISLSDDAYNILKRIKRKNESFSDVIKRIIGSKGNLMEIIDLYPELEGESELKTIVEEIEEEFNKKQEKIINEMH